MLGYLIVVILSLSLFPLSAVVVLGFDQTDYTIGELSEGGAVVRVGVLFGQLERTVAIWINSTEPSTATANQGVCE